MSTFLQNQLNNRTQPNLLVWEDTQRAVAKNIAKQQRKLDKVLYRLRCGYFDPNEQYALEYNAQLMQNHLQDLLRQRDIAKDALLHFHPLKEQQREKRLASREEDLHLYQRDMRDILDVISRLQQELREPFLPLDEKKDMEETLEYYKQKRDTQTLKLAKLQDTITAIQHW
jgi:hypothetical protein